MESNTQDNKIKPNILPLNSHSVVRKIEPNLVDIFDDILKEYFEALKQ